MTTTGTHVGKPAPIRLPPGLSDMPVSNALVRRRKIGKAKRIMIAAFLVIAILIVVLCFIVFPLSMRATDKSPREQKAQWRSAFSKGRLTGSGDKQAPIQNPDSKKDTKESDVR